MLFGRCLTVGAWFLVGAMALYGPDGLALAPGQIAPNVTLSMKTGGKVELSQLRGQVVLLNFWSSWCGPCREEFPALDQLYRERHQHGLVLIGIDVDAYPDDAIPFLKKHPVSFPIAEDAEGFVSARFTLDAMPMSVLIDRHGSIRWIHRGYNSGDEQDYSAQVDALLKET